MKTCKLRQNISFPKFNFLGFSAITPGSTFLFIRVVLSVYFYLHKKVNNRASEGLPGFAAFRNAEGLKSGFTGQYVALEVAKTCKEDGKTWAVAGRSSQKLEKVLNNIKTEIGKH